MEAPESLAVVIPVYQGADTLPAVVSELVEQREVLAAHAAVELVEVVMVHDGAIDDSATTMMALERDHELVRSVWLSRNFGQHAATLAGCASTTADWVVTMDEDGLHDPAAIVDLLRRAREGGHDLVYAVSAAMPHHRWRSATSAWAKWLAERVFGVDEASRFSSYRLMDGPVARSLAAYCGHGVYLDVAAGWVFASRGVVQTPFRQEQRPGGSGYSLHSLLSHFRRLTVTAGARPLRYAAGLGLLAIAFGLAFAVYAVVRRMTGAVAVPGWASLIVTMTSFFGLVLFVLGLVAEYLSAMLGMVSGRPPYLIVGRPPRQVRAPGDDGA